MKYHRNKKRFRKYKVLKSRVLTNQIGKKRLRNFIIAIIIGMIVIVFVTGRKGLIRLVQLRIEESKLKSDIGKLNKNNVRLSEEIEKLQKDPKTIEKIAREELGLVKKGETVYKFVPKKEKEKSKHP